jgi:acyl-ACP thioesterase
MPPSLQPASELVRVPDEGRRFVGERLVRLGDVDVQARMRFDAIARFLQDVATDDATEADLDGSYGWLVRRSLVDVTRPPRLGEELQLTTFCSGFGRSWAERRTSIRGSARAEIEAVSLWVSIDPTTGRPTKLDDRFHSVYGTAAGGRRVGPRLALARPPEDAVERGPWPIRSVDVDPYRHANNAAQWAAVEEMLGLDADRRGVAEIEFLAPIDPDVDVRLVSATAEPVQSGWLVGADTTVHTAFRFRSARSLSNRRSAR